MSQPIRTIRMDRDIDRCGDLLEPDHATLVVRGNTTHEAHIVLGRRPGTETVEHDRIESQAKKLRADAPGTELLDEVRQRRQDDVKRCGVE